MIQCSYVGLEDGTKLIAPGAVLYPGQPVALDANGMAIPAVAASKVYGLCIIEGNTYQDLIRGQYGAFGSGAVPVLVKGIAKVKASVYDAEEVTAGDPTASFTKKIFDDTKTYVPGEALYVDAAGLITNTPSSKISLLGKVLSFSDGWLELEVNASPATSASELA